MTNLTNRIELERFAASLYEVHRVKQLTGMAPATRKQTPLPSWPELGIKLRNSWRRTAFELIAEQRTEFPELDTPSAS